MTRKPEVGDLLFVGPEAQPRLHPCVTKTPDNQHHAGYVRPIRSGESILGDTVLTEPTETPGCFKVIDKINPHGETKAAGNGPAQVATEDYRDGWDRIFGAKRIPSLPS